MEMSPQLSTPPFALTTPFLPPFRLLAEEETHVRPMEAAAGGAAPVEQKEKWSNERTRGAAESVRANWGNPRGGDEVGF